tara:strand:+ start:39055 stop:40257 length:1203 start_codon:yes stop_codon:yes gene_type:complete
MESTATSSNIPPATKKAVDIPSALPGPGYQARVDFWGGEGPGGDWGVGIWKAESSGEGCIAAGGTVSAHSGFYWGSSRSEPGTDDPDKYHITRESVDLTIAPLTNPLPPEPPISPTLQPRAALKLTKLQPGPPVPLPDAQLMGKYVGIGDFDQGGSSYSENCNKFTVHCLDDDAAPEILLRAWSIAGSGSTSTVRLEAEAVEADKAIFFAGVGHAAGDSGGLSTELYGIRAEKGAGSNTGGVYLQLGGSLDAPEVFQFFQPPPGGTKTFIIPHPLDNLRNSTELLHSCVEAPTVDNIYRGSCRLMDGKGTVNLDSNDRYQMTQGTFQALNKDPQVHVTNNETFDRVKGEIVGNELHVICENPDSNANIAWLVIGTRQDPSIRQCPKTDDVGNLITERPRN